jgi:hypothetical protein
MGDKLFGDGLAGVALLHTDRESGEIVDAGREVTA